MKRIISILILIFICQFNTSYSQTKTVYEKKVDQIMTEMCNAIGVENSLIQMAIQLNDWDIVRTSQDLAFKSKMLDKNELLVIIFATEKKLKDAEKLKIDIDFRKEKEKKEKEKKLEEQEIQNELIIFSDLGKIKTEINTEFTKWAKKDEFETSNDYNIRINNKEKIIDSIAYELVIGRITELSSDCKFKGRYLIKLLKYDSDSQRYLITLIYKILRGETYQLKNATLNDTLIVSIDVAKKIKENSKIGDSYWDGSDGDIINLCQEGIFYSKELNNWAISSNGFIFPISYSLFGAFTHKSNIVQTPIIKLTLNTNDLGLQDYFSQNHIISIEQSILKKLEIKRNNLLKQAENLVAENKIEKAIIFFKEANQIRYTEDVKIKITDIETKITEIKQNEFLVSAELYKREGNMTFSIERLEKAKEFFVEANKLKYKDEIKIKINEVDSLIIDVKQNQLIKSAVKFEKSGKISNSIEKLQEAYRLMQRTDISDKIDLLKKELDTALSYHNILDSLFIIAQSEKLRLFNDITTISALDEVKNGYGQKYIDCKLIITTKIDTLWKVITTVNNNISENRNREIWNDNLQELVQKIKEFRTELSKYSFFEINTQKALKEVDKKYLKIFKEEDLNIIIETISNKY